MDYKDINEKAQKRIDRLDTICRWVLGLFCLFMLILAFASCSKKPVYKYTDGIYTPELPTKDQEYDMFNY